MKASAARDLGKLEALRTPTSRQIWAGVQALARGDGTSGDAVRDIWQAMIDILIEDISPHEAKSLSVL